MNESYKLGFLWNKKVSVWSLVRGFFLLRWVTNVNVVQFCSNFFLRLSYSQYTGCLDNLDSIHIKTEQQHLSNIIIHFHEPLSIPVYHAGLSYIQNSYVKNLVSSIRTFWTLMASFADVTMPKYNAFPQIPSSYLIKCWSLYVIPYNHTKKMRKRDNYNCLFKKI